MESAGEAVEILEAFDLTGSLRAASELAGCSPNTVARYVRLRAIGRPSTEPTRRTRLIDQHLAKVEEWVERFEDLHGLSGRLHDVPPGPGCQQPPGGTRLHLEGVQISWPPAGSFRGRGRSTRWPPAFRIPWPLSLTAACSASKIASLA